MAKRVSKATPKKQPLSAAEKAINTALHGIVKQAQQCESLLPVGKYALPQQRRGEREREKKNPSH